VSYIGYTDEEGNADSGYAGVEPDLGSYTFGGETQHDPTQDVQQQPEPDQNLGSTTFSDISQTDTGTTTRRQSYDTSADPTQDVQGSQYTGPVDTTDYKPADQQMGSPQGFYVSPVDYNQWEGEPPPYNLPEMQEQARERQAQQPSVYERTTGPTAPRQTDLGEGYGRTYVSPAAYDQGTLDWPVSNAASREKGATWAPYDLSAMEYEAQNRRDQAALAEMTGGQQMQDYYLQGPEPSNFDPNVELDTSQVIDKRGQAPFVGPLESNYLPTNEQWVQRYPWNTNITQEQGGWGFADMSGGDPTQDVQAYQYTPGVNYPQDELDATGQAASQYYQTVGDYRAKEPDVTQKRAAAGFDYDAWMSNPTAENRAALEQSVSAYNTAIAGLPDVDGAWQHYMDTAKTQATQDEQDAINRSIQRYGAASDIYQTGVGLYPPDDPTRNLTLTSQTLGNKVALTPELNAAIGNDPDAVGLVRQPDGSFRAIYDWSNVDANTPVISRNEAQTGYATTAERTDAGIRGYFSDGTDWIPFRDRAPDGYSVIDNTEATNLGVPLIGGRERPLNLPTADALSAVVPGFGAVRGLINDVPPALGELRQGHWANAAEYLPGIAMDVGSLGLMGKYIRSGGIGAPLSAEQVGQGMGLVPTRGPLLDPIVNSIRTAPDVATVGRTTPFGATTEGGFTPAFEGGGVVSPGTLTEGQQNRLWAQTNPGDIVRISAKDLALTAFFNGLPENIAVPSQVPLIGGANVDVPEILQHPMGTMLARGPLAPYEAAKDAIHTWMTQGAGPAASQIGNDITGAFTQSDEDYARQQGLQHISPVSYFGSAVGDIGHAVGSLVTGNPGAAGDAIKAAVPGQMYQQRFENNIRQGMNPNDAAVAAMDDTQNRLLNIMWEIAPWNPANRIIQTPFLEQMADRAFGTRTGDALEALAKKNGFTAEDYQNTKNILGSLADNRNPFSRIFDLHIGKAAQQGAEWMNRVLPAGANADEARSIMDSVLRGGAALSNADTATADVYANTLAAQFPEVSASGWRSYMAAVELGFTKQGIDYNRPGLLGQARAYFANVNAAGTDENPLDLTRGLNKIAGTQKLATTAERMIARADKLEKEGLPQDRVQRITERLNYDRTRDLTPEQQDYVQKVAAHQELTDPITAAWYAHAGQDLPKTASVLRQSVDGMNTAIRSLMLFAGAPELAIRKFADEYIRGALKDVYGVRPADAILPQAGARFVSKYNILGQGTRAENFLNRGTVRGMANMGEIVPDQLLRTARNPISLATTFTGTDRYGNAVGAGGRAAGLFGAPLRAVDKWNQSLISAPTQHLMLSAAYTRYRELQGTKESLALAAHDTIMTATGDGTAANQALMELLNARSSSDFVRVAQRLDATYPGLSATPVAAAAADVIRVPGTGMARPAANVRPNPQVTALEEAGAPGPRNIVQRQETTPRMSKVGITKQENAALTWAKDLDNNPWNADLVGADANNPAHIDAMRYADRVGIKGPNGEGSGAMTQRDLAQQIKDRLAPQPTATADPTQNVQAPAPGRNVGGADAGTNTPTAARKAARQPLEEAMANANNPYIEPAAPPAPLTSEEIARVRGEAVRAAGPAPTVTPDEMLTRARQYAEEIVMGGDNPSIGRIQHLGRQNGAPGGIEIPDIIAQRAVDELKPIAGPSGVDYDKAKTMLAPNGMIDFEKVRASRGGGLSEAAGGGGGGGLGRMPARMRAEQGNILTGAPGNINQFGDFRTMGEYKGRGTRAGAARTEGQAANDFAFAPHVERVVDASRQPGALADLADTLARGPGENETFDEYRTALQNYGVAVNDQIIKAREVLRDTPAAAAQLQRDRAESGVKQGSRAWNNTEARIEDLRQQYRDANNAIPEMETFRDTVAGIRAQVDLGYNTPRAQAARAAQGIGPLGEPPPVNRAAEIRAANAIPPANPEAGPRRTSGAGKLSADRVAREPGIIAPEEDPTANLQQPAIPPAERGRAFIPDLAQPGLTPEMEMFAAGRPEAGRTFNRYTAQQGLSPDMPMFAQGRPEAGRTFRPAETRPGMPAGILGGNQERAYQQAYNDAVAQAAAVYRDRNLPTGANRPPFTTFAGPARLGGEGPSTIIGLGGTPPPPPFREGPPMEGAFPGGAASPIPRDILAARYANAAQGVRELGAQFGYLQQGAPRDMLGKGYQIVGNPMDQTALGHFMQNGWAIIPPVLPFAPFHIHSTQFWVRQFAQNPLLAVAYAHALDQMGNGAGALAKLGTGLHLVHTIQNAFQYGKDVAAAGDNNLLQQIGKNIAYNTVGTNAFVSPFEEYTSAGNAIAQRVTNPLYERNPMGVIQYDYAGNPYIDFRDQFSEFGSQALPTAALNWANDRLGQPINRNAIAGVTNPGTALGNWERRGLTDVLGARLREYNADSQFAKFLGGWAVDHNQDPAVVQRAVYNPQGADDVHLATQAHTDYNRWQDVNALIKPTEPFINPYPIETRGAAPIYAPFDTTYKLTDYIRNLGEGGRALGVGQPAGSYINPNTGKPNSYYVEPISQAQLATARAEIAKSSWIDLQSTPFMDYNRQFLEQSHPNYYSPFGGTERGSLAAINAQQEKSLTGEIAGNALRTGAGKPQDQRLAEIAYQQYAQLPAGTNPNGTPFYASDLLGQAGNYYKTLDAITAAKNAGDKPLEARLIGELARIQAADIAQVPGLAPFFAAGNAKAEAARIAAEAKTPYGMTYNGWTQPQKDAFDAFNNLRASPDYRRYQELETQSANAGYNTPEEKAWYAANKDEFNRLKGVVAAAEASIQTRFGANPKELANQIALAEGKPAPYKDTKLTQPPGSTTATTGTGGGASTYRNYPSRSSGSSRGTSTRSSGTSSGADGNAFFDFYRSLTDKGEKAAVLRAFDNAGISPLDKGASAATYRQALAIGQRARLDYQGFGSSTARGGYQTAQGGSGFQLPRGAMTEAQSLAIINRVAQDLGIGGGGLPRAPQQTTTNYRQPTTTTYRTPNRTTYSLPRSTTQRRKVA